MRTHEQASNEKAVSIIQFYASDGTPILGMVHDMIKTYAANHSLLLHGLIDAGNNLSCGKFTFSETLDFLEKDVLVKFRHSGFPVTIENIENVVRRIKQGSLIEVDMKNEFYHIADVAFKEAEGMMLFPVQDEKLKYYNQLNLFGDKIAVKFPNAQRDLTEAGTCYALGCSTACVLHIMRALESALHSLADSVKGFKYSKSKPWPTMGDVAKELKNYADSFQGKTKIAKTKKDKLHSAAMHFKDITSALRNKAMHTGQFFSDSEAHLLLVMTKLFFNDLLDLVKTPRRRKHETNASKSP